MGATGATIDAVAATRPAARCKSRSHALPLTTRGGEHVLAALVTPFPPRPPTNQREPKLDSKDRLDVATEVAETRSCDTILLLEARKRADLYLWLAKTPAGPTVKFHLSNVHTMEELHFPGNNLLHSRPLLAFDGFDNTPSTPVWGLLQELLTHAFSAPRGHRHVKPFVDHILLFTVLDGRVWLRHYQITDADNVEGKEDATVGSGVVEIGPRLVLNPVRVFGGSMGGKTAWENPAYVGPNEIRRAERLRASGGYKHRVIAKVDKGKRVAASRRKPQPLDNMYRV